MYHVKVLVFFLCSMSVLVHIPVCTIVEPVTTVFAPKKTTKNPPHNVLLMNTVSVVGNWVTFYLIGQEKCFGEACDNVGFFCVIQ